MTMVEAPVPVETTETVDEEEHDHDDIESHLYNVWLVGWGHTLCGLKVEEDPHGTCHPDEAGPLIFTKGQRLACPACGAPLCMTCALKAS